MQNDEYRPSRFFLTMLPSFILPSQTFDHGMRRSAPIVKPDWRDEQLARAAYLLIVGIERVVRATAAAVRHVGRYSLHRVWPQQRTSSTLSAGRPRP